MSIRTSEQVDKLMPLLVAAQSKFGAAIKDSTNPLYKSKYADISSVLNATLEHLNASGIVLMQHPTLEWKEQVAYVTVTTRLQHFDQWIESDLTVPAIQRDKFDAQSVGTGITYACRYALQAILAIPREDDDGNAASGRGTTADAQVVAQQKIAKLKKELGADKLKESDYVPSLFYTWHDESQRAEVTGAQTLLTLHKPYLKQFWDPAARAISVNGEQLENLKYELEQRGVPFHPLKAM